MNNKMIKGSVAGATGIVLLMGGFGTYALWSDSETFGGTVESGELDIAVSSTPVVWDDLSTTTPTDDWDPLTDLVVPGDVITRTQEFDLKGYGKNLTGTISLSGDFLDHGGFAGTGYDWLDYDIAVTSPDTELTRVPGSDTDFTFSSPFETATLTAVVTFTVGSATADQDQQAQDATAVLNNATITIAQD